MDKKPPFQHSVMLKGEVVKVNTVDGGVRLHLRHGNENYKVFFDAELMDEASVRKHNGQMVRFMARKKPGNRWFATASIQPQK